MKTPCNPNASNILLTVALVAVAPPIYSCFQLLQSSRSPDSLDVQSCHLQLNTSRIRICAHFAKFRWRATVDARSDGEQCASGFMMAGPRLLTTDFKSSLLPTNEHDWAQLLGFLTWFGSDAQQASPPFAQTILLVSNQVLSRLLQSLTQDKVTAALGLDLDINIHFCTSNAAYKDVQTPSRDDCVWKNTVQDRVTTSGLKGWCDAQDKSSKLTAQTIIFCDIDQAMKPDAWGPAALEFFETDNNGNINEMEELSEDLELEQKSDSGSSATADGEEPEWSKCLKENYGEDAMEAAVDLE
ncbi:hypothetical protein CcaCcLH18_13493 [Colletotrichum camelliae]|nr:hypothetical protein CcaCcLH18_13493 [Colletotrichum camelliae]